MGLPKAATLFLAKQYALEYGHAGIRSNGINADPSIPACSRAAFWRNGPEPGGILAHRQSAETRSPGRGRGPSLRRPGALARKTTAASLTVDGGNIEASLR